MICCYLLVQAAKILANLVVIGSGILARALVQAYRQALANASKSGVAQETVQNIRRGSKIMPELEARQILGVTEHSSWEEILQGFGYKCQTIVMTCGKALLVEPVKLGESNDSCS